MDFSKATDEELLERLDIGRISIKLEGDDDWKLIKELGQRLVKVGYKALRDTPSEQQAQIENIQCSIKKYEKIFGELESCKQMGKIAFEEAKDREIIKRGV